MIRAILAGRKTQTRRILKIPPAVIKRGIHPRMDEWMPNRYTKGSGQYPGGNPEFTGDQPPGLLVTCLDGTCQRVPCPYGVPGDRLWCRETWATTVDPRSRGCVVYRADGTAVLQLCADDGEGDPVGISDPTSIAPGFEVRRWTPSIFMPRWASRITLEVTEVRVQRLWDITDEDATEEGVTPQLQDIEDDAWTETPRQAFARLWRDINGDGSWDANPWVWAIGFTVLR